MTSVYSNRAIAYWLFVVAFMVFVMVVLGGVTRLTHSGLSMVEWRPLTGWLPPMSDVVWEDIFAKYREFPEYRENNYGMTLTEFKGIFWLEFLHRLWGRVIGLAFFLPFVFFLLKGQIRGRLVGHMIALFVLGGLQGGLGWFMVKSGLVDRPDVSQYRLAAHLCLALVIYGYLIWVALALNKETEANNLPSWAGKIGLCLTALIFVTAFSGALVAGLDAGLVYNTFPLMDGELIPGGLLSMDPWYLNFFESIMTVQFTHRLMAITTFLAVGISWVLVSKRDLSTRQKGPINYLLAMVFIQAGLGIATLLMAVPVTLGALHQAGAVILLGLSVWTAYSLRNN